MEHISTHRLDPATTVHNYPNPAVHVSSESLPSTPVSRFGLVSSETVTLADEGFNSYLLHRENSKKHPNPDNPDDVCSDTVIGSVLSMSSPVLTTQLNVSHAKSGIKTAKRSKKSTRADQGPSVTIDSKVNYAN